jgi:hypothetical protein
MGFLVQSPLGRACKPLTCRYLFPSLGTQAALQVRDMRVQVPSGHALMYMTASVHTPATLLTHTRETLTAPGPDGLTASPVMGGEVPAQSLCAWLADVELSADDAN